MKKLLPLSSKILALIIFLTVALTGCKKDDSSSSSTAVPTVTTVALLTEVLTTSVISGGVVSAAGSTSVSEVGLVYSTTNQSPTIADSKFAYASVTDHFSLTLSSLTSGATYYIRAYATNSSGTGYGTVVKYTTKTTATATVATVTTFVGSGTGGFVNGTGTAAQLYNPQGMVADAQGNLYVADQFNHVIRKVTSAGVVSTFCGSGALGHVDGPATTAAFYSPYALAIDASNNIYVADQGNNLIVKITPAGVATTIAGSGVAGYVNSTNPLVAQFNGPRGLAVDATGNVYVADSQNNRIRMVAPNGNVSTFAGNTAGLVDSTNANAYFRTPTALAFDTKGNLFVADYDNHAIREITTAGRVVTIAGNATITNLIGSPTAIAIDASNNLYVADGAGRVLRLLNSATILNSLAGTAGVYGFADGTNTTAQFNGPSGIVTYGGALFVADYNNNRIRKITVVN